MPVCRTDKAGDAIEASRRPGGPFLPAQPLMTPPAPFSSSLPQPALWSPRNLLESLWVDGLPDPPLIPSHSDSSKLLRAGSESYFFKFLLTHLPLNTQ